MGILLRLVLALALIGVPFTRAMAASTALSNLSAGTTVTDSDLFYDVQNAGAGGVKVTASQLATYMSSKGVGVVNKTTVNISSSQILNAATTPVTIIPAQGANTVIGVVSSFYAFTYGSAAYTATSPDPGLWYGTPSGCPSLEPPATCFPADNNDQSVETSTSDAIASSSGAGISFATTSFGSLANTAVTYFNAGGAFVSGNGTMRITVIWTTYPVTP
jgi:hypothetical protein